jgi:hypothetical protein
LCGEAFAQRCITSDRRLKHLGSELSVQIVVNLAIRRGSSIIVIDHDPWWGQCGGVPLPNPLDGLVQLTQTLQTERLGEDRCNNEVSGDQRIEHHSAPGWWAVNDHVLNPGVWLVGVCRHAHRPSLSR